jgi:hypothetical protein
MLARLALGTLVFAFATACSDGKPTPIPPHGVGGATAGRASGGGGGSSSGRGGAGDAGGAGGSSGSNATGGRSAAGGASGSGGTAGDLGGGDGGGGADGGTSGTGGDSAGTGAQGGRSGAGGSSNGGQAGEDGGTGGDRGGGSSTCTATPEACNGDDDDCDGVSDNGCEPFIVDAGFYGTRSFYADSTYWAHLREGQAAILDVQAQLSDIAPADGPMIFHIGGPDIALLDCPSGACTVSDSSSPYRAQVPFLSTPALGRYRFTVSVESASGATSPTLGVALEVNRCVWYGETAKGAANGSTPSDTLSGSLQAALELASAAPDQAVCVAGKPTVQEDIVLPSTPYSPDLVGGFAADGQSSNDFLILYMNAASGLTFESGYDGLIQTINTQRDTTHSGGFLVLRDATLRLFDYHYGNGSSPLTDDFIGIDVSDPDGGPPTELLLASGFAYFYGKADSTGVRIADGASYRGGAGNDLWFFDCTGDCRGFHVKDATAENPAITVAAVDGTIRGVDVEGNSTVENPAAGGNSDAGDICGVKLGAGVTVTGSVNAAFSDSTGDVVGVCVGDGSGKASFDGVVRASVQGITGTATGILVEAESYLRMAHTLRGSQARAVDVSDVTGTARGVHVRPGGSVALEHNGSFYVEATEAAYGVDLEGTALEPTTARVVDNESIVAESPGRSAQDTVAIRLRHTENVLIAGNARIGNYGWGGVRFAPGIADGALYEDALATGGIERVDGRSTGLVIEDNLLIGGTNGGSDCLSEAHVAPGILLVGTTHARIRRNGAKGVAKGGIVGGSPHVVGDSVHALPAQAVGVLLIDTTDVGLFENEIRPGSGAVCLGSGQIEGAAVRDGVDGAQASEGLVVEANGLTCALEYGGFYGPDMGCLGIELNGTTAARVTDNYVFANYGEKLVGVRQRGGSDAFIAFNTLELGYRPDVMFDTEWAGWNLHKHGIELLGTSDAVVANNIVWIRPSTTSTDVTRYAVYETRAAGTSSGMATFANNLLFLEGMTDPDYVVVTDGLDTAAYDESSFDAIDGVDDGGANLAGDPLLTPFDYGYERTQARPLAGSPAIDAGSSLPLAPTLDIDGHPRSVGAAPDIGCGEFDP